MTRALVVALLSLATTASCVSDPVKSKPGSIPVLSGAAGGTPDTTAGGGSTGTGAAGGPADPTGAAGSFTDPTGTAGSPADSTGAAGATGSGGGNDDAGAGSTGSAGARGAGGTTGAAGMNGTAGTTGAAGTRGTAGTTGAAGGDAGAEPDAGIIVAPCDHHSWTFTPSVVCASTCAAMTDANKLPANAIDGLLTTRYTTGITQGSKGPEVVILTLPGPVTLTGVNVFTKAGDGPMSYLVESSLDGANFTFFNPSVAGPGSDNLIIVFPAPTKALALRITQTGVKKTNWWSIHELTLLGCAPAP